MFVHIQKKQKPQEFDFLKEVHCSGYFRGKKESRLMGEGVLARKCLEISVWACFWKEAITRCVICVSAEADLLY